jgi:hypothetical protein
VACIKEKERRVEVYYLVYDLGEAKTGARRATPNMVDIPLVAI